ncbi:FAD-binding protein [Cruoricaptor ignavus]|uniref:3-oxosteroid 1-dehydrogenase n=1 Tax=Cruoricaptor ignavus TaxID=1118202 RepID=A0A7M1T2E8_9FLAO|nr:FAD-binding protein [Cruoricaptor ignavus]QOR73921.1 FAD-binding protein [Cruoricaptor ignavus]
MKTHNVDFLVAGSGGGGMTAALKAHSLGLDVLIVEKAPHYGGSTAMSGGGIWAPNNYVLREHGIYDEPESVVTYMKEVTEGKVAEPKIRAYVQKGPEMFDFFRKASTHLRWIYSEGYSDYHPEFPGGRPEGRSIEAEPLDFNELGEDKYLVQPSDITMPGGIYLTALEFKNMTMALRTRKGLQTSFKAMGRTIADAVTKKDMRALGYSVIGRLKLALNERNIPLWLNSPVKELVVENDRVVGAIVEKDGEEVKVLAKNGVLFATGGFDHNRKMRRENFPQEAQRDFSLGSKHNTGDGIQIGQKLGAKLGFMDDAWWMPAIQLPNGTLFTLVSERAIPRSIIVGKNGKRFTNEASPYVNFVHDQIESGNEVAYQILDQTAVNRYMYGAKPPLLPFSEDWYKTGLVTKADTLAELAEKIGIDRDGFVQEVQDYNRDAETGKDTKFGKGESAYDRYYGDPTLQNPVMDEISKAPFYAVKVVIGDLGTKGGLDTNEFAQVIKENGEVIPGFYATGNTMASVMGYDYAGAGATIGPSMIFGYIAAEHAAKQN